MKNSLRILSFFLISLFAFNLVFAQKVKPKKPKPVVITTITKPVLVSSSASPKPESTPKPIPTPKITKSGIVNEKFIVSYTINPDGTYLEETEIIKRFDDELPTNSEFKRYYESINASLETIEVVEAFILQPDGTKKTLSNNKIKVEPTAETRAAPSFSSKKLLTIDFSEAKKGDKVLLKIKEVKVKTLFPKIFDTFLTLTPFESFQSAEIKIKAPTDYKFNVEVKDFSGGKIAEENNTAIYQWRLENYKAKEFEIGSGYYLNYSPRFLATNITDFAQIGKIFLSETSEKTKITPEIQKLADEITKDKKTVEEKANAIYEWVNKNIRYLSIIMDRSGWIPNDANTILENRYGDCKDYTMLLQTLLKAKNIESYPAVVRVDSLNWFTKVPTLYFFNHMILYIPSLKKFADGTIANSKIGDVYDDVRGKKAVLLGVEDAVIDLPSKNNNDYLTTSSSEIKILDTGNITSQTELIYSQTPSFLRSNNNSLSEVKKAFAWSMRFLFSQFGIKAKSELIEFTEGKSETDSTTLKLETEIDSFITFEEKGSFQVPPVINFANWKSFEKIVENEKRTTDLNILQLGTTDSYKILVPNGIKIESIPKGINFENELGKYISEYKLEGDTILVKRELLIKNELISTNDFPKFREFLQKTLEDVNTKFSYILTNDFDKSKIVAKTEKEVNKEVDKKALEDEVFESLFDTKEIEVSLKDVSGLEELVEKNPNDENARKKLLKFYSDNNDTVANKRELLKHKLWFVENRPESDFLNNYWLDNYYEVTNKEYVKVRDAWLKKLAENPTNAQIRKSLSDFVYDLEPELAKKLLFEGEKIDPNNFLINERIFEILRNDYQDLKNKKTTAKIKQDLAQQLYQYGIKAWNLLKSDRQKVNGYSREKLLTKLIYFAIDLQQFGDAKKMATELILEYSNSADAVHLGNIILGRIALRENNVSKAKEYLAIAIDAPLNARFEYLTDIDFELAKELLQKGEKQAVLDYLKQCEKLKSVKTSYNNNRMNKIKLWQTEINQGKSPKFNLEID